MNIKKKRSIVGSCWEIPFKEKIKNFTNDIKS